MITRREASSRHDGGEPFKPGARGLLEAIKGAPKATDHTVRHRVPRWWLHVDLLTQLTIEKCILNIKLRHGPMTYRSNNKKSADSGHVSHKSECLIVIAS